MAEGARHGAAGICAAGLSARGFSALSPRAARWRNQLDWHYHTFHKLIFFSAASPATASRGSSYPLEPGDVILVPQGCVHRPEAEPGAPYERCILYLSPEFLRRAGTADVPAATAASRWRRSDFRFVVRPQDERQALRRTLAALEHAEQQPVPSGRSCWRSRC
ncbi:MAG: AraC family ligand binding domain-containing protein [Oscillospiraceae bacterium]